MKRIKLHDKEFELAVPYADIAKAIENVAQQMNDELKDESLPIFLSVLNGAFMFTGDLMKYLDFNCELCFIKVSSYQGLGSGGSVNQLIGLDKNIEGRTVVLVEDIVDRGITLEHLVKMVSELKPKQLKIATMLYKPDAYEKDIKIDYIGMHMPNDFIVGYGLDYDGLGRNYPNIYTLVK